MLRTEQSRSIFGRPRWPRFTADCTLQEPHMYLGPRRPSLTKMLAARTSVNRALRHNLGLKAPRGYGWLTNPKRAAYNRAYYRKNKAWFSAGGILFLAAVGITIWVVQPLVATWYIWAPLLIAGIIPYLVQRAKSAAAAAQVDAARQAEEARLADGADLV